MNTLLALLEIISIKNKDNYTIQQIKDKLSDKFIVDNRSKHSLYLSLKGHNMYILKYTKGNKIRFYRRSPWIFTLLLILFPLIIYDYYSLNFLLNSDNTLFLTVIIFIQAFQIPEILYLMFSANRRISEIDLILKELQLER